MKVCLVQTAIYWEQKEANCASIEEKLAGLEEDVDWIILPEMFTTGFSVKNNALPEHPETTTYRWMQQQAKRYNAVISGSFITKDADGVKNSLLSVSSKGIENKYDKRNLFSFGDEGETFVSGVSKSSFPIKDFNCLGLICYDLRFPEWSRYGNPNYDCLFYVANWPETRNEHWLALLKARAIENQCYVIGVNRIGVDDVGLSYSGNSVVYDYNGKEIVHLGSEDTISVVELDLEKLNRYRSDFPFLKDIKVEVK